MEDYLTHKCVKNTGDRPQYFVEDDHDPIVPKAVFYQVQGEKKRRSGLAKDPSKLRFGNRLALNGRLICGKCGRTLKRYVKPDDALTDWRCRQRALVKKTDFHEDVPTWCDCRIVREAEAVEETGACRDYDDFFSRTRYTVPEGVLDENGRMEAFNNDLVIRYLDRVVVKDDGYEVAFKAGVTVEIEV